MWGRPAKRMANTESNGNLSCPFSDEVLQCISLSGISDGESVGTGLMIKKESMNKWNRDLAEC